MMSLEKEERKGENKERQALLAAHLGVFITCAPNYRLVNSCSKFWSETGKLPTLMDIVDMCKQTKGPADQQLAANILGQSPRSPYIEQMYNLFLTRFICCFGIYPSATDTESSFSFFLHAQRFPNPVELTEVAFHLQEAEELGGGEKKLVKNNLSKLEVLSTTGTKELPSEDCCICLEPFKTGERTTRLQCCKRVFHYGTVVVSSSSSCGGISTWLLTNSRCPMCNATFVF